MHFLKRLLVLCSIMAAIVPVAAMAQYDGPRATPEYLRALDRIIAERDGLLDGSYVFVGYAGDDLDNAEIILPKEIFAQMIGNMVVMGDLPPDRVEALTRAMLKKSRQYGEAFQPRMGQYRERRAQVAAILEGGPREAEAPPPAPAVQAAGPTLFERLRGGPGGIGPSPRAVAGGSATGGMLPGMRSDPPQADESDSGAIAVPTLPTDTGPTPFTDWMTGTFDNGSNVFTLNRGSGSYLYANGTMAADKIDGTVVEGVWTQSSSGQQCTDGGYHGRFRITFTEDGFSGVFGYCDEPPAAPGGFQGRRRK